MDILLEILIKKPLIKLIRGKTTRAERERELSVFNLLVLNNRSLTFTFRNKGNLTNLL